MRALKIFKINFKIFFLFTPILLGFSFFTPAVASFDREIKLEDPPFYLNTPLPYNKMGRKLPKISAKSAKTIDLKTNHTLFEKEADKALPIGSLTKIMTAILTIDDGNLDEIVEIPILNRHPEELTIGLHPGEKVKRKELLKAALIPSAGDATRSLAISVSGSEEKFIKEMNKKAKELDLKNTNFTNVIGLDTINNYSTASDLILLTRYALQNETFREIIKQKEATLTTKEDRQISFKNTNILLDGVKFQGIKTGSTPAARECLIVLSENNKNKVLTVLLGSENRFDETLLLTNWIYDNFVF